MTSTTARRLVARFLVGLTFVTAVVAGPVFYAAGIIDDEDRFVAVAGKIVEHPEVRRAIATEVTETAFEAFEADEALADVLPEDARVFAVPLTRIASDNITNAAFRVLDTDIAVDARNSALREVHRQLSSESDDITLDFRAVIVRTTRELAGSTAGSGVAKLLSDTDSGRYTIAESGSTNATAINALRSLPDVGAAAIAVVFIVLLLAVAVDPDHRGALVRGGLALAAGAFVSVVVVSVFLGGSALLSDTPLGPGIGQGLTETLISDFSEQQRGAVVAGVLLAAVGLLLGGRSAAVAARRLPGRLWRREWVGSVEALSDIVDDNPALARILMWIGGAVTLVSWSNPTGRVVVSIIVVSFFFQIATWVLTSTRSLAAQWRRVLQAPDPLYEFDEPIRRNRVLRANLAVVALVGLLLWPGWDKDVLIGFFVTLALTQTVVDIPLARRFGHLRTVDEEPIPAEPVEWRRRYVLAGLAAVAVLILAAIATVDSDEVVAAEPGCNGHTELCDRAVDDIVWPGSHNSMSSIDLGWELAMQTGDIIAQLDHGIRALLIDTHYWDDSRSSDVEGDDDAAAAAVIESALANGDEARPGTWLCHGFCALGATDFVAALSSINVWLDENPRDVVMMVVQDEISTADTFVAFQEAGLIDRVHNHEPGTPWPTLAELIEADERVLVYAENAGAPESWYQNAYTETFFDTPFKFSVRSEFSCDVGRGVADNPLFLINHWLTTGVPVREAATAVNRTPTLRARVDDCLEETGRLPTVLAVDFAQDGDLVPFVAELNGIEAKTEN